MPSSASICSRARRADVAEPGALVADHDALLGVALDVEVGVRCRSSGLSPGRSSRGRISSTTTAIECGSSSRTPSRPASRISSATRISSGESVRSPSGQTAGPRQQPDQQVRQELDLVTADGGDRDDLGPLGAVSVPQPAMSSRCEPIRWGGRRGRSWWRSRSWSSACTLASSLTMNRSPGPIFSLRREADRDHVDLGHVRARPGR